LYIVGKFNWGSIIKQVLKKSPDKELPVKKLRKKVKNKAINITPQITASAAIFQA